VGHWHVSDGGIKGTKLILFSILLCIDDIDHLHCGGGGQTARIECVCSTKLGARHKALHSAIMWPRFCCKGLEQHVLFILLMRRLLKKIDGCTMGVRATL